MGSVMGSSYEERLGDYRAGKSCRGHEGAALHLLRPLRPLAPCCARYAR